MRQRRYERLEFAVLCWIVAGLMLVAFTRCTTIVYPDACLEMVIHVDSLTFEVDSVTYIEIDPSYCED